MSKLLHRDLIFNWEQGRAHETKRYYPAPIYNVKRRRILLHPRESRNWGGWRDKI